MPITDSINCACVDSTGYRTLAELRADVYAALGFVDPYSITQTRTLPSLRSELFRMLGFAAMGTSYPPGMSDLLDDLRVKEWDRANQVRDALVKVSIQAPDAGHAETSAASGKPGPAIADPETDSILGW